MSYADDVTQILNRVEAGDARAAEELLPLVYEELRQLAAVHLHRETAGQTLQATALVHEVYLRLVGHAPASDGWANRRHFFAAAAESMRRILVENARRKHRHKHGGQFTRQPLDDLPISDTEPREDLLTLDEALTKFAVQHRQAAELVQLRYFAGLTISEAAVAMDISERTAARLWVFARAWLLREIQGIVPVVEKN